MLGIADYQITEKIYESSNSLIYRAIGKQTGKSYILKVLKESYPTPSELTRYKQEYTIISSLNLLGVIQAYDLLRYENKLVMVVEDFGGESLENLLHKKKVTLEESLSIFIKIAESLGEIHAANILHKDINPSNIVYNPETQKLKIIDFGISTILSRENPILQASTQLEGTLAYISPEQTGRMNRALDRRTDFYSLGVTFYQLLTHQLPFATTDPLALVHSHIAKQPVPPHLVVGEERCPKAVADIIMKLMAKPAEERYQSAWGLKADLETCLYQLQNTGQIISFPLARRDITAHWQISQKLYGREEEIAILLNSFEKVSQGATKMITVAGYSGIGKSSLVNEIHKPIAKQGGFFISGKYDQFKRDIPYSAIIQAFQELISQLLGESASLLQTWRQKLLEALGINGQVIVDVIPEVELIIGKQPPVSPLEPVESQNRFNLVFQQFINIFTAPEHPLVIFLDDLQWADAASLKLLEQLITNPEQKYLLMIGAYRDNEVDNAHPLIMTLERIEKAGIQVNNIVLQPLGVASINQLIADSFYCPIEEVRPLAELVKNKTDGNPFFLTQLLQSLYREKLLKFNHILGCWQWDIEQIQAAAITNNVVELMISKIEKLNAKTQNILKLAACIGNRFDLEVLSFVNAQTPEITASELWPALQEELIVPLDDSYKAPMLANVAVRSLDGAPSVNALNHPSSILYKFLHDRVQQAAYLMIPDALKKAVHLQVGQLLLKNIKPDELEEYLFDIVNQLNIGAELILESSQRNELAKLNLQAGKKAKASTAYQPALRYLEAGLNLLASDSWDEEYELTFELHLETLEALYLNTQFARADSLSHFAVARAKSLVDKVKLHQLKISFDIARNQMDEAIQLGLAVLEQLNVSLVKAPLKKLNLEAIYSLPLIKDPHKLAALSILKSLYTATFISKPPMMRQITYTMVDLSLNYGNSPLACYAYMAYAVLLCGDMSDVGLGYELGIMALKLLEKFNDKEMYFKVNYLFLAHIRHWKHHTRDSIKYIAENIQRGLETGGIEYTGYSLVLSLDKLFLSGDSLDSVSEQQKKYINWLKKNKQDFSLLYAQISGQLVQTLREETENKYILNGDFFRETEILSVLQENNNFTSLFLFYSTKVQLSYLLKNFTEAVATISIAEEYEPASVGLIMSSAYSFYSCLSWLAHHLSSGSSEPAACLEKVSKSQQKLKIWAEYAPMNFLHKYHLVEAEKARVLGDYLQAMEYYDRAIKGAREQGYVQEEAIAYERAAEFYLWLGREEIGLLYLKNAHHCYSRWGATTKVKELEAEFPRLLIGTANQTAIETVSTTSSTTNSPSGTLDLTAVIKASQVLAGEMILNTLLEKLMKIVIADAGAEKGFLILNREGNWVIESAGSLQGEDEVTIFPSLPLESIDTDPSPPLLSTAIVNYVIRTHTSIVLDDAAHSGQFPLDRYIQGAQPKSILCTPLLHQGQLKGILYLENNLITNAFTCNHLEVLKLLSSQAAIYLQNSQLYVALQESEKKLAQFLDAVPVGVYAINSSGKLYYANRTAQEIAGKSAMIGAPAEQLPEIYQVYLAGSEQLYPSDRQPIVRALKGESVTVEDAEFRRADRVVPLELSATPIFDEQGQILYAIGSLSDITQRKQAEAERIEYIEELALKNMALEQAKNALADYSRTLEQKVTERTQELSRTLEVLKATQAELLFENELLRSTEQPSRYDYQVGGSLPMDAPTYVVRSADRYLYKAIKRGEFSYILNPRQMGKSSLMVRMIHYLQHEGYICAAIDLGRIGSENMTPQQWYKGIAAELGRRFGLRGRFDLKTWWDERGDLSPAQRLSQFIEDVLLVEAGVTEGFPPKPLLVFIDEVDSVLGLNFSVNDFFALIRSCYNLRALQPEYRRLTFALFGVATPADLMTNIQTTPFNIGHYIELEGFKEHEAQPLLHGLAEKVNNPQTLLKEVLAWTNGQPFLTQKLCQLVRSNTSPIPPGGEARWLEGLVQTQIIDNWETQDEPEHLKTIRDRLLKSKRSPALVDLYRQVLQLGRVRVSNSPEKKELLLTGLVIEQQGFLQVNNPIYEAIFNRRWLELQAKIS